MRDAYAVLVSEFMLQQTTVKVVIPYFERWMESFPTVDALASAPEEEVLAHWQGLGYYSRARNLQRAAQAIVERHGGRVPASLDALCSLPGVGDYTAGAVAAFAFDAVVPVIDANIARVLTRLGNWRKPIDDACGRAFLGKAAEALLPDCGGRLHTSALMELGALVCLPRTPLCSECPVKPHCRAENPEGLPVKRVRKAPERVQEARAFVYARGKVWLQLSSGPWWQGLWVLPVIEAASGKPVHREVYPITRFRVTMEVFSGTNRSGLQAFPADSLPPMPSPHVRAVKVLLKKANPSLTPGGAKGNVEKSSLRNHP